MADIRVPNGFDLRIAGLPEQVLADAARPSRVALRPGDFPGLRPKLLVEEGASVKTGTSLLGSKDCPRFRLASPGTGRVEKVRWGPRRSLIEVVVALEGEEQFEPVPKASAGEGGM